MRIKVKAEQVTEDTLEDKDGDTKVQVEKTDDEDVIRFATSGSERMTIGSSGEVSIKSGLKFSRKAISFDGAGDYISISDNDAFTFATGGVDQPFTIQAWIQINDTATDEGTIISKYNANTDAEWLFWQDNGKIRLNLYDNNETPATGNSIKLTTDNVVLSNDTWHHVVITYDGSESHTGISAYVDGSSVSSTTSQSNTYNGMRNTSVPVRIGGNAAGSFDFEKRIASVAIFDKVLSASEISELYNSGKVLNLEHHSAYSNLISWWRMGDNLDTTGVDGIKDYANGYHGTLNGDASIVDETALDSDFQEYFQVDTSGNIGINTTSPTEKLDIVGDAIRVRNSQTPASSSSTGETGMICWDSNYVYVCIAPNTWKRSALSTW